MPRQLIDQELQIHSSETYTDTVSPSEANFETNPTELMSDMNNVRSMLSHLLDVQVGNWYDQINTPSTFESGAQRGVSDLNTDLHELERKRILRRRAVVGADIVVPSGVAATGTLTLTGNALNAETVTIDTKVYTFQTVLTDVDGNVLIGATASDSLDNLIAAITLGAGSGTLYAASMTLHPTATAAAGAGDTMDASANAQGTAGNTIATTETLTNGSWGGATLSGGAGDMVILGSGELPGNTTAAIGAVTTRGTVLAYNATFGTAILDEVSGGDTLTPKNLARINNATTGDKIVDGSGNEIHALFHSESNTDGSTITDTTPNRVQLSFVIHNATNDDLILVDGQYIGGATIDYAPVERYAFDDVPEHAWLGTDFVDAGASASNRQGAYDNQGTVPVDVTASATLDLEGAGLFWRIRDDNEVALFTVTENSGTSATTVALGTAVDVYDNNAAEVNFAEGITVDDGAGGIDIEIGVTAGQINTTSTDDLEIQAGGELYFDDGNRSGSTWATDGILLSDTTAEWDAFEDEFGGEVSLLAAIVAAAETAKRSKGIANVITADISANTNVTGAGGSPNISATLPSYNGLTFVDDVDVYLNGVLQRPGADASANNDVYPGDTASNGDLKFEYTLRYRGGVTPDVVTSIVWGEPTV